MSTDFPYRDSPWARLPLTLPLALLFCLAAMGLLPALMGRSKPAETPPQPIAAELVELPPSPPPAPKTAPKVAAHPPPVAPRPSPPRETPPPAVTHPAPSPAPAAIPAKSTEPVAPPPAPTPAAPATTPAAPLSGQGHSEIRAARALIHPLPVIPDDLRNGALNEVAQVRFHITRSGEVSVELLQATRDPRLNRLILSTLKTWKFFPAIADGHPIDSTQDLDIHINVQ